MPAWTLADYLYTHIDYLCVCVLNLGSEPGLVHCVVLCCIMLPHAMLCYAVECPPGCYMY